ncbi:MAG: hypothetical protein NWR30_04755 [Salibacteraceae bacterium]|nr:hypothetical protein [Salibacteraceae bacterium]
MTDHQLNELLAKWAGYTADKGTLFIDGEYMALIDPAHIHLRWTPLTDHNQMALVKAGLRKRGYWVMIVISTRIVTANIMNKDDVPKSFSMHHENELRALALAIEQLGEPTP